MTKMNTPADVAALLAAAEAAEGGGEAFATIEDGEPGTAPRDDTKLNMAAVEACAKLDHSDTDNSARLIEHFGADLLVLSQAKAKKATYAVWAGTHWDIDTGDPRSLAVAQMVGGRIALEVAYINPTPAEKAAIDKGAKLLEKDEASLAPDEKKLAKRAEHAIGNLAKRQKRRMDHAVSTKNKGRLEAMLACAAPHIMRKADQFNADHYRCAVNGHTLVFSRRRVKVKKPFHEDPFHPDYDPNDFQMVDAVEGVCTAVAGHSRADLITQIVPVDYDENAACPSWSAFMERMIPSPPVRRMVQVASGLGLLGVTVQKLFFHYGSGANGKSVYMETMCRLLGGVAVTLPATSFIGEGSAAGAANPDVARLYGKRHLRVKELPEGEELRENLVKELTGGEDITVRDLFQGYFDFKPLFTAHMSGNGFPRINGTDNGIWRRMAVVPWVVTIPDAEQRDFEEMVSSFEPEYPGILNWMIAGALAYLGDEGLRVPDEVKQSTQEYRDVMDPTSDFCAKCVVRDEGYEVTAKDFFQGYVNFVVDQGGKPVSLTKFGLIMKRKFNRVDGRVNVYKGLRLIDVPRPANAPPLPDERPW